jgi:hypothetical protein
MDFAMMPLDLPKIYQQYFLQYLPEEHRSYLSHLTTSTMSSTTSSTTSASTRLSNLPHTNFPGSVWFYNPSLALAVVATLLFVIPSLVLLYFTLWPQKRGSRHLYFICIVIGGALEVAGYVLRAISTKNQTSTVLCFPAAQRNFLE